MKEKRIVLNPNNDRLDYGVLLSAPDKYKLDFAIGTTYSLDLDALVGASLSLGLSEETDSELARNPIATLEALRITGDKIALFCEAGQIHMPAKITSLYVLLEQMVYQVLTPKKNKKTAYPSFHPKFWLIRYVDEQNQPLYRIIVLSRNLTFDRSWDVTFCMDGKKQEETTDKNDPVKDFISYLIQQSSIKNNYVKVRKIRQICDELSYIHFDLNSKEFYDYDFIPVGVNKPDGSQYKIEDYPLFKDTFHEVMIMSPFLSGDVIKSFNNRNGKIKDARYVLITRSISLPRLKYEDCDNFKIFTVKDNVIEGETIISEENTDSQQQDIHAKIYMVRKYSDTDLYLGSLNASHNALNGNVEFMIRLRAKRRNLDLDKLLKGLFCGKEDNPNNPFQLVDIADIQEVESEKSQLLDSIIKEITHLKGKAAVIMNGDNYDINIKFNKYANNVSNVVISPLLANKEQLFSDNIVFSDLKITQLSNFYKISASDKDETITRIIIIPTIGLPENRDEKIVSSVINNKENFYQYISFLLGDRLSLSGYNQQRNKNDGAADNRHNVNLPALYEKMLYTAANEPENLKEIDSLLKAVSKDGVVPENFEETYNIFKKAVKLS
ncbi:MAG: phospholipase D family protein [Clostridia bacterium]|nr:phospholipase D family protein [Clostridia bacterium]